MREFSVLELEEEIPTRLFLEAGAGSGKTFTMIHLMQRWILCQGLETSEIVALTFTRKAAAQMKARLFQELSQTLARFYALFSSEQKKLPFGELQPSLSLQELQHQGFPPYVAQEILNHPQRLVARLTRAIDAIEQLEVATVHSFAFRRMELLEAARLEKRGRSAENFDIDLRSLQEQIATLLKRAPKEIKAAAQGLGILRGRTLKSELGLLKRGELASDYQGLIAEMALLYSRDLSLTFDSNLSDQGAGSQRAKEADFALREELTLKEEESWKHLLAQKEALIGLPSLLRASAPYVKGVTTRSLALGPYYGALLTYLEERLSSLSELASCNQEEPSSLLLLLTCLKELYALCAIDSWKKVGKSAASKSEAAYRGAIEARAILASFFSGIELYCAGWLHLELLLHWLKKALKPYLERKKERAQKDYAIKKLARALKNIDREQWQQLFPAPLRALLVDEFQDTDPWQWQVFSQLVALAQKQDHASEDLSGAPVYFAVVGDPKQSIYRFREADIYTYLRARKLFAPQKRQIAPQTALQEESLRSLPRNWRAQPQLVEALNAFFDGEGFLEQALRLGQERRATLHFTPARSAKSPREPREPALLFWTYEECLEEELFWESVTTKIVALAQEEQESLAILVADHRQGALVARHLEAKGIELERTRPRALALSPLGAELLWLLKAFASWPSRSLLRFVLSSSLLGYQKEDLQLFAKGELEELQPQEQEELEQLEGCFERAARLLREQGLAAFWGYIDRAPLARGGRTIEEQLQLLDVQRDAGCSALFEDYVSLRALCLEAWPFLGSMKALLEEMTLFLQGEDPSSLLSSLSRSFLSPTTLEVSSSLEDEEAKPSRKQKARVTILTVHASKGLEFSSVITFAGDAFPRRGAVIPPSSLKIDTGLIERLDGEFYALTPLECLKGEQIEELVQDRESERMRLLYVALTRAQRRQIVIFRAPFEEGGSWGKEGAREQLAQIRVLYDDFTFPCEKQHAIDASFAQKRRPLLSTSAMKLLELWSAQYLVEIASTSDERSRGCFSLFALDLAVRGEALPRALLAWAATQWLDEQKERGLIAWEHQSGQQEEEGEQALLAQAQELKRQKRGVSSLYDALFLKESKERPRREADVVTNVPAFKMSSFSRWAAQLDLEERPMHRLPEQTSSLIKQEPAMPGSAIGSGSLVGQLWHSALERWWLFRRANKTKEEAYRHYEHYLERFFSRAAPLASHRILLMELTKELFWHLELAEIGARLIDLEPSKAWPEARFVLDPHYVPPSAGDDRAMSSVKGSRRHLPTWYQGYIDLWFVIDDRLYFVDYKSNHLGSSRSDYEQEALWSLFVEKRYDLQAALYGRALKLFGAQQVQSKKGPLEFGGGFYLFLRSNSYLFIEPQSLEVVDVP